MEAFREREQAQRSQKNAVEVVGDQLEVFRSKRSEFLALGFAAEELDRLERVMLKFREANAALSKHPEPVRIMTGIAESTVDFERRHSRWRQDVAPHLKMIEMCRREVEKFAEKTKRLSGN